MSIMKTAYYGVCFFLALACVPAAGVLAIFFAYSFSFVLSGVALASMAAAGLVAGRITAAETEASLA